MIFAENDTDDVASFPIPNVELNNGLKMPIIGLGTSEFHLQNGPTNTAELSKVRGAVEMAIDVGYRNIDTAFYYGNEGEIGEALKKKISEGVVKREYLFINIQLWNTFHRPEHVLQGLKKSLKNLQLDFVDCFLVHMPVGFKFTDEDTKYPADKDGKVLFDAVDHVEMWREMEKAVDLGLAKSIGLSNFNQKQIQHVLDSCRIKPAVLQIETHAYLMQNKLFAFCKANQIVVVAYAPLGSKGRGQVEGTPILHDDPVVEDIATRLDITSAQVLLRYLVERGRCVIPKSTFKPHLQNNLEIFSFALSEDDLGRLDQLDRNVRYFPFEQLRGSPEYPF
ncbi:Aldo-keto reductase family 1 member C18 [Hypsibius exemplaris]|uniref:Aldo-keto reductase family 1 member C18 n=1 Tax=Hypsibius exemplaris TaxID=2072580 RepID=A0A9X6NI79_HYPEX|nr:Aldo-keto reductase family 1 member C18 [Hypsibius exemplaris]